MFPLSQLLPDPSQLSYSPTPCPSFLSLFEKNGKKKERKEGMIEEKSTYKYTHKPKSETILYKQKANEAENAQKWVYETKSLQKYSLDWRKKKTYFLVWQSPYGSDS